MKILLFTHMQQIEDYAGFMNGLKRAGPVQTVMLTLGREECELGRETGAFDAVKDILPGESELDGPDADLTVATQALKDMIERLYRKF